MTIESENPQVTLTVAFSFVCSNCGKKNYVDAAIPEFSETQAVDIYCGKGEYPNPEDWRIAPMMVECDCGKLFDVEGIDAEDE